MKPGQYIQLLQFFSTENRNFLIEYSTDLNIELIECCLRFDELRELHSKFKKECDTYLIYPHLDYTKLLMLKDDIIRISNEFKIEVSFPKSNTTWFKKGIQAFYNYKNYKLNDLIIFNTTRKKSHVSSMCID